MSDRDTADFLRSVALLEGSSENELAELGRLLRTRDLRAGELLWQQGELARELAFIVDGRVAVSLHVPGDRVVEIGTAERGDVVGEIGLLDGGEHTMSARVTSAATVLVLGRRDFA